MAFRFGQPITLIPNLLQYISSSLQVVPAWGLGTLEAVQLTGKAGPSVVIGFGNMSNGTEFPVLMFHLGANGTYALEPSVLGMINWPSYAGPVFTTDLNGDSVSDVLMPGAGGHNPSDTVGGELPVLALSNPGGGWRDAISGVPQEKYYTHSWDVGDVDGNGSQDVLLLNNVFNSQNPLPVLLLNDGSGNFVARRDLLPRACSQSIKCVYILIFQGDRDASKVAAR